MSGKPTTNKEPKRSRHRITDGWGPVEAFEADLIGEVTLAGTRGILLQLVKAHQWPTGEFRWIVAIPRHVGDSLEQLKGFADVGANIAGVNPDVKVVPDSKLSPKDTFFWIAGSIRRIS